jgi:pyruvate/2-oxoglutarate dehydrogenase complex dihydrolipoamide acyltransferase (E2) component
VVRPLCLSAAQVIAVLDTDKVSVDIRSTVAGKATKWHGAVGDNVKVGSPLLTVELGAEGSAPAAEAPKPIAPVLTPAGAPSSDVDRVKHSPRAESGAQAPTSIFPTDPLDTGRRQPSIAFRYVRREAEPRMGTEGMCAGIVACSYQRPRVS